MGGGGMKAHELLADISKWTVNAQARDGNGRPCSALNIDAVQWCADGAINKCYGHSGYEAAFERAIAMRSRLFPGVSLYTLNDSGNYDAVMQVLREADV
jgi:hypothetical protein